MAGDTSAMIALQPALKFNGGGHINHGIFWTNLSPNGGGEPTGIMDCIYGLYPEPQSWLLKSHQMVKVSQTAMMNLAAL